MNRNRRSASVGLAIIVLVPTTAGCPRAHSLRDPVAGGDAPRAPSEPQTSAKPQDPDAACVNLGDHDRILACGPRVASEALQQTNVEFRFIRLAAEATDICAALGEASGSEGPFPPLSARCTQGPRHRCTPTTAPRDPWEFEPLSETDYPLFSKLVALEATSFHYGRDSILGPTVWHRTLRWESPPEGCAVDFVSVADVDGDGEFATKSDSLLVRDGVAESRRGPTGPVHSDFIPEKPATPISSAPGFVPLPDAGCEKLSEQARVRICGPFKLQHLLRDRLLDFRDDSLSRFVDGGLCFVDDFGPAGETVFYPPDSIRCHEGPRGQCSVAEDPKAPWQYPPLDALQHPYWSKLASHGFKPEMSAYSSKQIRWQRKENDECEVELEVKGDLDGDGTYGRYTTRALVGPKGEIIDVPDPGTIHPE